MPARFTLIFVLALPVFASAVLGAAEPAVELIDGVRHVRNGAAPLQGERTLDLAEAWRIDIEEEEVLIGVVNVALAGPDDSVWLADQQLGQILVYSAQGEHVATLSREGEGPGEVRAPSALFWLPDGTLGIKDRKPGQFTVIDRDGVPRSSIQLVDREGESLAASWLPRVRCRDGVLAVVGYKFGNDEDGVPRQSRFFSIFDLDGQEQALLLESPSGFDFDRRTYDEKKNWFLDLGQFDVTPDGRVIHAVDREQYRLEVRDRTGKLLAVIERDYEPRRRSAEELEDMADNVSMNINGEDVRLDSAFLPTAPAISGVRVQDDGTIWVLNGHGGADQPEGIARSYDVFDPEGRFVEVVRVATEYDDQQDRLIPLADGRWVMLRNLASAWGAMSGEADEEDAEEEPLQILCLRPAARGN